MFADQNTRRKLVDTIMFVTGVPPELPEDGPVAFEMHLGGNFLAGLYEMRENIAFVLGDGATGYLLPIDGGFSYQPGATIPFVPRRAPRGFQYVLQDILDELRVLHEMSDDVSIGVVGDTEEDEEASQTAMAGSLF